MGLFGFGREGASAPDSEELSKMKPPARRESLMKDEHKNTKKAARRFFGEGQRTDNENILDATDAALEQRKMDEATSFDESVVEEVRERADLVREVAEKQFAQNFEKTLEGFLGGLSEGSEGPVRDFMLASKDQMRDMVMSQWIPEEGKDDIEALTMEAMDKQLQSFVPKSDRFRQAA